MVISGGPGSGKTTLLALLKQAGYDCFEEISREIINAGKAQGLENYFLADPMAFSRHLWEGRLEQYAAAKEGGINFYDRGLHDVTAYLRHTGVPNTAWENLLPAHGYDKVFLIPPVQQIYQQDQQRMESFDEAVRLHKALHATYGQYHRVIEVPFCSPQERLAFVLNHCNGE